MTMSGVPTFANKVQTKPNVKKDLHTSFDTLPMVHVSK